MAYTTINNPSAYSTITLYTGNGQDNRAVTNSASAGNFKPDWLWIKERSSTSSHRLFDTSRGASKRIESDTNSAEATDTSNQKSFDTNGFTLGTSGSVNANNDTYVAWQWKANGGTTASNSNGTITSTVQANTTAGFSIISYTGNGTNGATIGHGLSQTPQIFFPKCLSTTTNWEMYYFPTGGTKQYGYLNLTNAFGTWSYTAPTSTTIGLSGSGDSNGNGRTMIGYAFHSVQGYSKIGTYTGNNNADGSFVYTGFKPAWLLIKNYSSSGNGWTLTDNARSPINEATKYLLANTNDSEATGVKIDLLSNGFKLRATAQNESQSYIYMAFAENPLVATNGVPATAR